MVICAINVKRRYHKLLNCQLYFTKFIVKMLHDVIYCYTNIPTQNPQAYTRCSTTTPTGWLFQFLMMGISMMSG